MKWRAAALIPLLCLVLSGCWSRIEVNDLAIVTMAGLDQDPDGSLRVSLQIIVPHRIPYPGGEGRGAGSPIHVISATGESVVDVIQKLQLQQARRLYFAHTNAFIIGERLARAGLQPVEDFINRFRDTRLQSYLLVVRGDPLEILRAEPEGERLPSEAIRQLERANVGVVTAIWEWAHGRRTEGMDPVLPWIMAVPPIAGRPEESGRNPDVKTAGSALFAGARLVGWLDDRSTRGLKLLRGEKVTGRMAAPFGDKGMIGVRIDSSRVKRQVTLVRGKPAIDVHVRMEVTLGDMQPALDARDPRLVLLMEESLEKGVASDMRSTLAQAKEEGVDPFGFGALIHDSHPDLWHQVGGRWREALRTLPVSISVKVDIDRSKLITRPRSIPDGEMLIR